MEALAAISLASSIVQFVDFGSKLLSTTKEIKQSANALDATGANLETSAQILGQLSKELASSFHAVTQDERNVNILAGDCKKVADELLTILGKLKKTTDGKRWASFRQALRQIMAEDELDRKSKRMDGLRSQLNICLQKLML
jgi:ABC-type transporter Mla subunit MlaD